MKKNLNFQLVIQLNSFADSKPKFSVVQQLISDWFFNKLLSAIYVIYVLFAFIIQFHHQKHFLKQN